MAHAFNVSSRAAPPRARAAAALALALLAGPLATASALAAPQLQCSFDVNSETHHKTFGLVTDPYTTEAVAIGNRFRFKAVMLAGEGGACCSKRTGSGFAPPRRPRRRASRP